MHASNASVARLRRRRLPTVSVGMALTLACSGVAAAQASAATIAVGQACVVNPNPASGSPMAVTGSGFRAGDSITLTSDSGGAFSTATADASGNVLTVMSAPILPTVDPAAHIFTLTATDSATGTTASTPFHVANLAVTTNPLQAKPNKKVTWSFSGFIAGAEIYAHYVHGKKVTARAKFGRAQGPCGTLKKKAVFYPGKAKFDLYNVQIDDSRHYSPKSLPRLVARLRTHIRL